MNCNQISLTIHRSNLEVVIDKYSDNNYLLIQSAEIGANKLLLTFDRISDLKPPEQPKPIKAVKLSSSDEIPDSMLEELFKK